MASRAFWTEDEVAVLEEHVHDRAWLGKVLPKLDRGEQALRCKMAKLRAEMGLSDPRCSESSWMRDARMASDRLAEATLAVGRWS